MVDFKEEIDVIENSQEAMEEFGFCYGAYGYKITKKQAEALLNGKIIAIDVDCEYSVFLRLEESEG